jgi:hypothetical protein
VDTRVFHLGKVTRDELRSNRMRASGQVRTDNLVRTKDALLLVSFEGVAHRARGSNPDLYRVWTGRLYRMGYPGGWGKGFEPPQPRRPEPSAGVEPATSASPSSPNGRIRAAVSDAWPAVSDVHAIHCGDIKNTNPSACRGSQGQQDLNPQCTALETAELPVEPHPYVVVPHMQTGAAIAFVLVRPQ